MSTTPVINFDEIKSKVASMSPEEKAKKLLAFRSRQLLQQAKQKAKGGQAAYNKRRNEELKMLKASLTPEELEAIEAQAKAAAEAEFEKFLDEQPEEAETENVGA